MITEELRFQVTDPTTGRSIATDVTFDYDPREDPYAIQMTFHRPAEADVTWFVGRQLLAGGMLGNSGAGDIRAWAHGERYYIDLCSPDGQARLLGSTVAVRKFLARTWVLVPNGSEHHHFDTDALIARLLEGTDQ